MKDEKTKIRQEKIIELVSSFCDEKLDEEYKELSIKLVEKLGRKHDVPFKRGKVEIWASAIIYSNPMQHLMISAITSTRKNQRYPIKPAI